MDRLTQAFLRKICLKNVTMILEVMGVLNWVLYLNYCSCFSLFNFETCTRNSQKWIVTLQETSSFSFEKIENPAAISGVFFWTIRLILKFYHWFYWFYFYILSLMLVIKRSKRVLIAWFVFTEGFFEDSWYYAIKLLLGNALSHSNCYCCCEIQRVA